MITRGMAPDGSSVRPGDHPGLAAGRARQASGLLTRGPS